MKFLSIFMCFFSTCLLMPSNVYAGSNPKICSSDRLKESYLGILDGAKRIVLIAETVPAAYVGVPACKNSEMECANRNPIINAYPERREKFIQDLKNLEADYPAMFYEQSVLGKYSKIIKFRIKKLYTSDCAPDLVSFSSVSDQKEVSSLLADADTVTIKVRVTIVRETSPHSIALTVSFSRPTKGGLVPVAGGVYVFNVNENEQTLRKEFENFSGLLLADLN